MTTADADHAIAQVLDAHEAAYHPGIACPETQEGRCALARPVESPEARMRDARTDHTFATYLDRTERDQLDARAACAEQERDDARDDLQELRTDRDRLAAEVEQWRATYGETALRDAQEIISERNALRDEINRVERTRQEQVAELHRRLDQARAERDERLTLAESSRLAKRYDQAAEDRDAHRQQLDTARAELGAAQELLAVVDDLAEQLDRARARYATRPDAPLGSPTPRAQDNEKPRIAPFGCDDCNVGHGQPHRYADCPTNLRQIERDADRARP